MISEKKINYYLHFAENSYNPECKKIITQLVDEVRKLLKDLDDIIHDNTALELTNIELEKEAEYLAGWIEWCPDNVPMGACYDICSDNNGEFVPKEKCIQCWRNTAKQVIKKK